MLELQNTIPDGEDSTVKKTDEKIQFRQMDKIWEDQSHYR